MKQRSNKRAKINVLRQFYVIGVMEQFEDTLEMFEHTLPRFFTGISSLWSTQGKYYSTSFYLSFKPILSGAKGA